LSIEAPELPKHLLAECKYLSGHCTGYWKSLMIEVYVLFITGADAVMNTRVCIGYPISCYLRIKGKRGGVKNIFKKLVHCQILAVGFCIIVCEITK